MKPVQSTVIDVNVHNPTSQALVVMSGAATQDMRYASLTALYCSGELSLAQYKAALETI